MYFNCFFAFYIFIFYRFYASRTFYLNTFIYSLYLSIMFYNYYLPAKYLHQLPLFFNFLELSRDYFVRPDSYDLSLSKCFAFYFRMFYSLDILSVIMPPACLFYKLLIYLQQFLICLYTFYNYFLITSELDYVGINLCYFLGTVFYFC